MDEIIIGAEQELHLAPQTEKLKNAEEIAKISLELEKYPFIIEYDANEKDNIITTLQKLGCDEIKQLDFADCIVVSLSMAQLKAIKTLVGVEKVEKDYDYKCLINGVNKMLGAGIGLVEGILVLWVVCIALTAIGGTEVGADIFAAIASNPILSFIYNNNLLVMYIL